MPPASNDLGSDYKSHSKLDGTDLEGTKLKVLESPVEWE